MKICIISDEYTIDNHAGGIGTYSHYLANALCRNGHDITVITKTKSGFTKEVNGVKIVGIPNRIETNKFLRFLLFPFRKLFPMTFEHLFGWVIPASFKYKKLYEKEKFDFTEVPELGFLGLICYLAGNKNYIVKLHTPRLMHTRLNRLKHREWDLLTFDTLERISANRAAIITSPSRSLIQYISALWNIDTDRVEVDRNLIDTEYFRSQRENFTDSEIVFDKSFINLFFAGRIEKRKGVVELLDAFYKFYKETNRQDVKLYYAGRDTEIYEKGRCKSFVEYLKNRYNDPEFYKQVTFLGGIGYKDIYKYYLSSDIVVLPSKNFENFAYTNIEAMLWGKPLILSETCGTSELVKNYENAVIVNPSDTNELKEAIKNLINNPDLRNKLSQNAIITIENECSFDKGVETKLRLAKKFLNPQ